VIGIFAVGPRGDLLNIATWLPVEQRLEMVRRPVGAGLPTVKVARMVNNCMHARAYDRQARGKDDSL